MARLATFVHVSDLHLGVIDPATGGAQIDAHTEPWLQQHPRFDGYLGHGGDALRHLAAFFAAMVRTEGAKLIVTGDLTTVGAQHEFLIATDFLTRRGGGHVGLGVTNALETTIPGNHDQWSGQRASSPYDPVMFGGPTSAFATTFPAGFPRIHHIPMATGAEVVLVHINSDADVGPGGLTRLLARARFDSQIAKAARLLASPVREREVRVLVMHHSPAWPGLELGMSARMKAKLLDFVRDSGIRLILTGHAHRPRNEMFTVFVQGMPIDVMECRCGTTTQRDVFPPSWAPRRRKPLEKNSLLVHRIAEDPQGRLEWSVETLVRGSALGFSASARSGVPAALGKRSVQVWP